MNDLVSSCLEAKLKNLDSFSALKDDLVSAIASKTFEPLQLVEALEGPLTSMETQRRSCACELLAQIIQYVILSLSNQERLVTTETLKACYLHHICVYRSCLLGGLQGCLYLLEKDTLAQDEIVVLITDAFFENLDIQSLKFSQRLIALRLLNLFIQKYGENLTAQDSSLDLVEKTIASIDGEKDPRCLSVVLQIVQDLVSLYSRPSVDQSPLSKASEELFDVVSCYFPLNEIESTRSTDYDRDELVELLYQTMTCSSLFSEFCIPLLLEKLNSDHQSAKICSLQCLRCCAEQFQFDAFLEFLSPLWLALQPLIFSTDQTQTLWKEAILTVQKLAQMPPKELHWTTIVDLIFDEETLLDTVMMLMAQNHSTLISLEVNSSVLNKIAWLNDQTILKTLNKILLPALTALESFGKEQQHDHEEIVEKNLTFFYNLMHSLNSAFQNDAIKEITLKNAESLHNLTTFLKQLSFTLKSFNSDDSLKEAFSGKLLLLKMKILSATGYLDIFSETDFAAEVHEMFQHIFSGRSSSLHEMQDLVIDGFHSMILETYSHDRKLHFSKLCSEICSSYLLPDELFVIEISSMKNLSQELHYALLEDEVFKHCLEQNLRMKFLRELKCCSISGTGKVMQRVSISIENWLAAAHENPEKQISLTLVIYFLRREIFSSAKDSDSVYIRWVEPLFKALINFVQDHQQHTSKFQNYLQKQLMMLFFQLMQICDRNIQKKFMKELPDLFHNKCYKLVLLSGVEKIGDFFTTSLEAYNFWQYCINAESHADLYAGALAAAKVLHSTELMSECLERATKLLATMNVALEDQFLFLALSLRAILSSSYSYTQCCQISHTILTRMITVLSEKLQIQSTDLLLDKEYKEALISKSFQSVISLDACLGISGYLLWASNLQRQRAFSIYLEAVLSILRNQGTLREGALLALGYLMIGASKELVKMEWQRLVPEVISLLDYLQTTKTHTRLLLMPLMTTLSESLIDSDSKDVAKEHRNEILRYMLKSATYDGYSGVREVAIKCLMDADNWLLQSPDDHKLYLAQIMEVTTMALDDKKRMVRKMAVKAKTKLSSLKKS